MLNENTEKLKKIAFLSFYFNFCIWDSDQVSEVDVVRNLEKHIFIW